MGVGWPGARFLLQDLVGPHRPLGRAWLGLGQVVGVQLSGQRTGPGQPLGASWEWGKIALPCRLPPAVHGVQSVNTPSAELHLGTW